MELRSGSQPVPGYRLTQQLGSGAFSKVWEARREDGQSLAFKFLDCRALSPRLVANEVKLLRSLTVLNHPNILPLVGVHTWGKYLILMMEQAELSLHDLHQDHHRQTGQHLPPDIVLNLLEQAAGALDFLAVANKSTGGRGLQHCDIKPSNLLIVGDQLKIADFGLAAGSGWHTHTGWKGTRPYAAPELFGGAAVPGTDQYALAITFCELVIGSRAFVPGDFNRMAPGVNPIDLTKLREREFPIISRALHSYPSARYPSCREFVQALRDASDKKRSTSCDPLELTPV